ncbi:protein SERAC1 [Lucilia cuprina]|uniref:protein SERAC1 n=1 Tax=Lucilia cuprina TaxID=7375 RepID=UPI001F068FB9|nr:protein SERAC1 [Lucilia cuprina]
MNNLTTTLRRYPKTLGSVGILTTCGLILYDKRHLQRFISKFVDNSSDKNDKTPEPDYIYIKYHIYKESMRKLKQQEEDEKKWISVIVNPVGKWWKAVKHSIAWRLLNIAQTGSHHERLKAVRQLARIDHLKDWDFRHLAQICDARTAVSLARSGADTRWFIPVHMKGCIKNPKLVLSELHGLLERLKPRSCVKHFFAKYFPQQDPVEDVCEFFTQDHPVSFNVQETDMLKEIIAFLHHVTKEPEVAEQIIKEGGLVHLMELCKIFSDDNETLSTLCKVLANMSIIKDSVEHFFVSGWISVLAEWQQCPDLRLQVISAKTMANLDHDDPNYTVYAPNVYPLHPRLRTRDKPKADIIFVHGLLGGVFITWRQKDRKPTELGLYGKNAFYTSETDDVFLVGEQRRIQMRKNGNGNGNGNAKDKVNPKGNVKGIAQNVAGKGVQLIDNKNGGHKESGSIETDALLKATTKHSNKPLQISDNATKELVETLQNEAELDPEWEVVHPDVPLAANENCSGEFSVPGNEWLNQDHEEEYTNCWPMEWLPEDYPNTRIIGIDYTSAVTEWSANFTKYCPCEKGQGHLDVRATSLLERITKADIGNDRPVVWIGHSMGGILTKLILMKAKDSADPQAQQMAKNTNGIVFLGVPHRGSPIAKWKQHMQMILSPSIEVKEMEENAPKLLQLHERFMNCLRTSFRHMKIVSIAEGSPTMLTSFKFPLRIVTEESACINHGDFYVLKDDHLSLSKPIFRQSFLYKRLLQVIDETVNEKLNPDLKEQLPVKKIETHSLKSPTTLQQNPSLLQQTKDVLSFIPQILFKFSTT